MRFLGCGAPLERQRRDECSELREREKSCLKTGMTGNQTFVGERFDNLELQVDMRFNEMESRITKVEEDVSYIRSSFDLPPPPPPSS